ncbi:MAG: 30S ribosomal protein S17 [Nitrosomonas sp.]|jgi:small subunit ribosomal protein S17|nr:30S ribosomal protein S17 [Nitrosomonas sp.]
MDKNKLSNHLIGRVVSNSCNKTIIVKIDRKVRHPLYGKILIKSKKFHVHDESNQYKVGDIVTIYETRPISKTKFWQVIPRVG